jgi:hypothetical protein
MPKLSTYVEALTSTIGALVEASSGAASFSIVSSALECNTGAGSDAAFGGINTTFSGLTGDIDEDTCHFEITALPTGGRCDIALTDASESGYRLRLTSTQWTLSRMVGGTPTTVAGPTTWASGSHKWFRVREASGTTYLEFAPDNGAGAPGTWSTAYSEATTTSGWAHTALDLYWFAPNGAGTGVSRYRYLNTNAPVTVTVKTLAALGVG